MTCATTAPTITSAICEQEIKMSIHESFNAVPRLVKSIAVAAALTLPNAAALSESMDVVKARADQNADQNIDRQGRDSVYAPMGTLVATPVTDPQQYGRAGGYVGADRVTVLEPGTSQPSDTVRTGQSEVGHVAQASIGGQVQTYESAPAQPPAAVDGSVPGTPEAQDTGRPSGDRFDNPQGAHGQDEIETSVQ
jgi:hypothetical protein